MLYRAGTDEEYHMMTRGKLMDRVRVALAGSIAVRVVLGEDTNFGMAGEQQNFQVLYCSTRKLLRGSTRKH